MSNANERLARLEAKAEQLRKDIVVRNSRSRDE